MGRRAPGVLTGILVAMSTVVCVGSYDPLTYGHLDVISRAAHIFDRVIVAVAKNSKKTYLFPASKREEFIVQATADLANVQVVIWEGLACDLATRYEALALVKGIRNSKDTDSEMTQAFANRQLSGIDTILIPTSPENALISSSVVKEIAAYGGDVSGFVPPEVAQALQQEFDASSGNENPTRESDNPPA